MQSVGIKTLKNRLSEYIRAAAAGETVLVTDRGRVVAEIIAPRVATDASRDEQILADLERRGLLTPARIPPEVPPPPLRPAIVSLEELMRELDQDRADR
jgi:antitoxin (DNA-binding transcriptional repressor) of toxin-antitoxin stability system